MKLIELHILQSFPVSCLNRDDVGSPKTAVFGGVQRARLSSQCLKRAVRMDLNLHLHSDSFHTKRTKLAHEALAQTLAGKGIDAEDATHLALEALSRLVDTEGAKKAKKDKNGRLNMPALIWLSPNQLQSAADIIISKKDDLLNAMKNPSEKPKDADKDAKKANNKVFDAVSDAIKKAGISDAPDIALFGRMVANDASLNVEGSSMFSHALSTHKASNDIDFYSAVDDVKAQGGEQDDVNAEDAGAGMIGTLEFTSATYYRYAAVNLDLLFDNSHLGKLIADERKAVLDAFIRATLMAVPGARKNSMNAATLPFEVLGILKDKGQPIQLINAFETPVAANGKGLNETSLDALKKEHDKLKQVWGINPKVETWLIEDGLETFISKLIGDVK